MGVTLIITGVTPSTILVSILGKLVKLISTDRPCSALRRCAQRPDCARGRSCALATVRRAPAYGAGAGRGRRGVCRRRPCASRTRRRGRWCERCRNGKTGRPVPRQTAGTLLYRPDVGFDGYAQGVPAVAPVLDAQLPDLPRGVPP